MSQQRDGAWPASGLKSALLGLLLLALASTLVLLTMTGAPWAAWLFAALALLCCCVLAAALGYQWAATRLAPALREARAALLTQNALIDLWQWQTDREHHLVRLQPPLGAPASAWAGPANGGHPVWERFDDDKASLRQRMLARSPITDLTVRRLAGPGPQRLALRGMPRLDARGEFCGYQGVARALDEELALRADSRCLRALLRETGLVLLMEEAAPADQAAGPGSRVRLSPAALALLRLDEAQAATLTWDAALAALPEALRPGLAALTPGRHVDLPGYGAWLVQQERGGRALLLVPRGDDEAARAIAAEHQSFSYTVSHDLRAPLRVVEGFARILKEDHGRMLDRIGNDHLDRVLAAAARMNQMIDALLSLSQLSTQPLSRQSVNLSQIAQYVLDDLRRGQPQREVQVHVQPGLMVQGDPTLLRMALENLLGNAWKYTARTAGARIAFEQAEQGGRSVYVVSDNGAGFDMRFADRLFGVFQRLHGGSDFPGTGVGLASVRRIVRRHGGDVWAEGEPERGARFYFTLGA